MSRSHPMVPNPGDTFTSVSVHHSAQPEALEESLRQSLTQGRIPGWYLYATGDQSRRWLAYHQAYAPSSTDSAVGTLYEALYRAGSRRIAGRPVHLLGLGAGSGQKDADLLTLLAGEDARTPGLLAYTPLDISVPLALQAAARARSELLDLDIHPLVADLEAHPDLASWLVARERACFAHLNEPPVRLITCFGVLPNQPLPGFLSWLRALLRPGDLLMLSTNLSPEGLTQDSTRILAQYDNPFARAWYSAALAELGLASSPEELAVTAEPLTHLPDFPGEQGQAWRIVARLTPGLETILNTAGKAFAVGPRRPLEVFHSQRVTATALERILISEGLSPHGTWLGARGEEGICLCAG